MTASSKLMVDTGFFVALLFRRDKHHLQAVEFARRMGQDRIFITTWPVMTEVCHLLQRYAPTQVLPFLNSHQQGAFEIFPLGESDMGYIVKLIKKYADLPMDLADASLVVLAETLEHGEIVSTDQRDFKTYQWKKRKPFKNLFL